MKNYRRFLNTQYVKWSYIQHTHPRTHINYAKHTDCRFINCQCIRRWQIKGNDGPGKCRLRYYTVNTHIYTHNNNIYIYVNALYVKRFYYFVLFFIISYDKNYFSFSLTHLIFSLVRLCHLKPLFCCLINAYQLCSLVSINSPVAVNVYSVIIKFFFNPSLFLGEWRKILE